MSRWGEMAVSLGLMSAIKSIGAMAGPKEVVSNHTLITKMEWAGAMGSGGTRGGWMTTAARAGRRSRIRQEMTNTCTCYTYVVPCTAGISCHPTTVLDQCTKFFVSP